MFPLEFHTAGTGTHPYLSSLLQTGSPHDQPCNTGLSLGLAGFKDPVNNKLKVHKQTFVSKFDHLLPPPLSLGPSSYTATDKNSASVKSSPTTFDDQDKGFGGGGYSGRRHIVEEEEASPCMKKLRLTKDQYALLEDIFKNHATLNPNQKQGLAKQLNLRPRQVEVWFQNRRARTKLKQTKTECELLKKCCERLTEENKRLHMELLELKLAGAGASAGATATANTPPAVYMNMPPAATLSICPSCDINVHRHRGKPPVLISNNTSAAAPNPPLFIPHSSLLVS